MNEEAAAKDAVNDSERPVPGARSTLEQWQESVHDWKSTTGADLGKESVIGTMTDEVDAMGEVSVWKRTQGLKKYRNKDRSNDTGSGSQGRQ